MFPFEFVITGPPISLQTKNRKRLQDWKIEVRQAAELSWNSENKPCKDRLTISITYFYDTESPDVDNIIKPIQDALIGLIYEDDSQIVSAKCTKKDINNSYRIRRISPVLAMAFIKGDDFLHIKISLPHNEEVLE